MGAKCGCFNRSGKSDRRSMASRSRIETKTRSSTRRESKYEKLLKLSPRLRVLHSLKVRLLNHVQKQASKKSISKIKLGQLLPEGGGMDKKFVEDVFESLDTNDDGEINMRELIAAITALTENKSLDDEMDVTELMFKLFDGNSDGHLDYEEFCGLMRSTINSKLLNVLRSPTAVIHLERYMSSNQNAENIHFWKETTKLMENEETYSDAAFREEAEKIYNKFVVDNSVEWVNLSYKNRNLLDKAFAPENKNKKLPRDIFAAPTNEIFHLMKRDVFHRFKHQREEMNAMSRACWKEFDINKNGSVSISELKAFFKKHPHLNDQRNLILRSSISHAFPTNSVSADKKQI